MRRVEASQRLERRKETARSNEPPAESLGQSVSRSLRDAPRNVAEKVAGNFGYLGQATLQAARTPGARGRAFYESVKRSVKGDLASRLGSGQIGRYLADKIRGSIPYSQDPEKNFQRMKGLFQATSADMVQIKSSVERAERNFSRLDATVTQLKQDIESIRREQGTQQRLMDQIKQLQDENKGRSTIGSTRNVKSSGTEGSTEGGIGNFALGALAARLAPFLGKLLIPLAPAAAGAAAIAYGIQNTKAVAKDALDEVKQAKTEDELRKALGSIRRVGYLIGEGTPEAQQLVKDAYAAAQAKATQFGNKQLADTTKASEALQTGSEQQQIDMVVNHWKSNPADAKIGKLPSHLTKVHPSVRGKAIRQLNEYETSQTKRGQYPDESSRRQGWKDRSVEELAKLADIEKSNDGSVTIKSNSPNTIYLDSSKIVVKGDLIVKGKIKTEDQPNWAKKAFDPEGYYPEEPSKKARSRRRGSGRYVPGIFGKSEHPSLSEQLSRSGTDMDKQQFLAYGQLPRGFENVPGHMGILGSPGAVMARGAMPLGQSGGMSSLEGGIRGGGRTSVDTSVVGPSQTTQTSQGQASAQPTQLEKSGKTPDEVIAAVATGKIRPGDRIVEQALAAKGLHEGRDRAQLMGFLKSGGKANSLDPSTTPWCAAFVNASLAKSGIKGTGSAAAKSFFKWGQQVTDPASVKAGDVVVKNGHVSIATGAGVQDKRGNWHIPTVGGNESNSVKEGRKLFSSHEVRRATENEFTPELIESLRKAQQQTGGGSAGGPGVGTDGGSGNLPSATGSGDSQTATPTAPGNNTPSAERQSGIEAGLAQLRKQQFGKELQSEPVLRQLAALEKVEAGGMSEKSKMDFIETLVNRASVTDSSLMSRLEGRNRAYWGGGIGNPNKVTDKELQAFKKRLDTVVNTGRDVTEGATDNASNQPGNMLADARAEKLAQEGRSQQGKWTGGARNQGEYVYIDSPYTKRTKTFREKATAVSQTATQTEAGVAVTTSAPASEPNAVPAASGARPPSVGELVSRVSSDAQMAFSIGGNGDSQTAAPAPRDVARVQPEAPPQFAAPSPNKRFQGGWITSQSDRNWNQCVALSRAFNPNVGPASTWKVDTSTAITPGSMVASSKYGTGATPGGKPGSGYHTGIALTAPDQKGNFLILDQSAGMKAVVRKVNVNSNLFGGRAGVVEGTKPSMAALQTAMTLTSNKDFAAQLTQSVSALQQDGVKPEALDQRQSSALGITSNEQQQINQTISTSDVISKTSLEAVPPTAEDERKPSGPEPTSKDRVTEKQFETMLTDSAPTSQLPAGAVAVDQSNLDMFKEPATQPEAKTQEQSKFLEANVTPEQPKLPEMPSVPEGIQLPGGYPATPNAPPNITGLPSEPAGPAITAGIAGGPVAGETVPGKDATQSPAGPSPQQSTTASPGGSGEGATPNWSSGADSQAPSPGSQGTGSFGRCFL